MIDNAVADLIALAVVGKGMRGQKLDKLINKTDDIYN